MKTTLVFLSALCLLPSAFGEAPIVWFTNNDLTGFPNQTTLNIKAVNNPVVGSGTFYSMMLKGTNIPIVDGVGSIRLLPNDYICAYAGVPQTFNIHVTNSLTDLNAADLTTNLVRYSGVQGIQVTGNGSVTPPTGAGGLWTINIVGGGGGGSATNIFFLSTPMATWGTTNGSNFVVITGVMASNNGVALFSTFKTNSTSHNIAFAVSNGWAQIPVIVAGTNNLSGGSNVVVIELSTNDPTYGLYRIYGPDNNLAIAIHNRWLIDDYGHTISLDWSSRTLHNGGGAVAYDWDNNIFYDQSGRVAIDHSGVNGGSVIITGSEPNLEGAAAGSGPMWLIQTNADILIVNQDGDGIDMDKSGSVLLTKDLEVDGNITNAGTFSINLGSLNPGAANFALGVTAAGKLTTNGVPGGGGVNTSTVSNIVNGMTVPIDSLAHSGRVTLFGVDSQSNVVSVFPRNNVSLSSTGTNGNYWLDSTGGGASAFTTTNIVVTTTNLQVVDVSLFNMAKIIICTNANIQLTNVSSMTGPAFIETQLDTNGTWSQKFYCAGGVLQQDSTVGNIPTNANTATLVRVYPGLFSTNAWIRKDDLFTPDVAVTNSLQTGGGGGGGSYTYFFTENFEGSQSGPGGSDYDNSGWTSFSGTPDPTYSTSGLGLEGSRCVHLVNAGLDKTGFNKSDLYGFFKFRIINNNPSIGTRGLILGYNSTTKLQIGIDSSRHLVVYHGGTSQATTATISDGTTYYVWFEYHKGTGANGAASAAFSTSSTKPTSGTQYCSVSTGDATANIVEFVIDGDGGGAAADCAVDMFRLSDSNIGDNPN